MAAFRLLLIAGLAAGAAVQGQEEKHKDSPGHAVEVLFANGTQVRMVLSEQTIEIVTPQGKARIPVRDIRRIDFGIHVPPGVDSKVESAVKRLASDDFKVRIQAQSELVALGRWAVPGVGKAMGGAELEVKQRCQAVLKRIRARLPAADLEADDRVTTPTAVLAGRIVTPVIKLHGEYFGAVEARPYQLQGLYTPEDLRARINGRYLLDVLEQTVDLRDFQESTTLKDCLGALMRIGAARGKEFSIIVDRQAFADSDPASAEGLYQTKIQLPPAPRKMKVVDLLRLALRQIESRNAAFLIRRGVIEVTTSDRASPAALLAAPLAARFEAQPLDEVLDKLAESTGISVMIDPRVQDKAKARVSGIFRNNVSVEAAARLLAQAAGLHVDVDDYMLFVTHRPRPAVKKKG